MELLLPNSFQPGRTVIIGPMPPSQHNRMYLNLKMGILKSSTTSYQHVLGWPGVHWSVHFPCANEYFDTKIWGNRFNTDWSEEMEINEKYLTVCLIFTRFKHKLDKFVIFDSR